MKGRALPAVKVTGGAAPPRVPLNIWTFVPGTLLCVGLTESATFVGVVAALLAAFVGVVAALLTSPVGVDDCTD